MLRDSTLCHIRAISIVLVSLIMVFHFSCGKKQDAKKDVTSTSSVDKAVKDTVPDLIAHITSEEHFTKVFNSSSQKLVVIDFYADWCVPCKVLAPKILEIARDHGDKASFYKLDIEKHRRIAIRYRVMGIPYIVFIKNKKIVHAITGISPKEAYIEAIVKFSQSS